MWCRPDISVSLLLVSIMASSAVPTTRHSVASQNEEGLAMCSQLVECCRCVKQHHLQCMHKHVRLIKFQHVGATAPAAYCVLAC
jgi:hypothetical protein